MPEHPLQPLADLLRFQHFLFFGNLEIQMRRHRIGELAGVLDLVEADQHLRRNLLVQFDILLELRHDGPPQRLQLLRVALLVGKRLDHRLEIGLNLAKTGNFRPPSAFHKHLDRAIGKLQQLQDRRNCADPIDIVGAWIILGGVFLRHQQYLLVVLHHRFERSDGLFPSHEQRHDHVRKYNDVPQRQDGQQVTPYWFVVFSRWAPRLDRVWPIEFSHC